MYCRKKTGSLTIVSPPPAVNHTVKNSAFGMNDGDPTKGYEYPDARTVQMRGGSNGYMTARGGFNGRYDENSRTQAGHSGEYQAIDASGRHSAEYQSMTTTSGGSTGTSSSSSPGHYQPMLRSQPAAYETSSKSSNHASASAADYQYASSREWRTNHAGASANTRKGPNERDTSTSISRSDYYDSTLAESGCAE